MVFYHFHNRKHLQWFGSCHNKKYNTQRRQVVHPATEDMLEVDGEEDEGDEVDDEDEENDEVVELTEEHHEDINQINEKIKTLPDFQQDKML